MEHDRFESSVSKVLPDLQRHAERLTRSDSDAQDLLQDSILRAWKFRDSFEEGTNLKAWLRRILFNTFVSEKRRQKREQIRLERVHREQDVEEPSLEGNTEALELRGLSDELLRALSSLPESYRNVVELVDIEQKSYREAADVLGCPIGTVMSRLNRARQSLRKQLEQQPVAHPV